MTGLIQCTLVNEIRLRGLGPYANASIKKTRLCDLESNVVEKLFDEIESAAYTANNFQEFLELVRNLYKNIEFEGFPIIKYLLNKILSWVTAQKGINFGGERLNAFFDMFKIGRFRGYLKNYFVVSYGMYNRWNPRKGDEIKLFKQGFEYWRYSGKSKLFKGRTLIVERQPFGIKQRVVGSQIGFMIGFRGLYIDRESRLTGNSYYIFIGGANRIRASDITPFSG